MWKDYVHYVDEKKRNGYTPLKSESDSYTHFWSLTDTVDTKICLSDLYLFGLGRLQEP